MDIDSEDDLDFVEDKIKNFLLHKLEEIEVYNAKTKEIIDTRKKSYNDSVTKSYEKDNPVAVVSVAWKKIYNNSYIIGYNIKNEGKGFLKNITVLLNWNSSNALNYKTFIYADASLLPPCNTNLCDRFGNLKESVMIKTSGYFVVVLEIPQFIDNTYYQIQGSTICQVEDQQTNISMPTVEISTTDVTNRAMYQSEDKSEDILSMISSAEATKLLLILPNERSKNLDSTFEIHCSLTKMDMFDTCKTYFIASRVSTLLDGSLLEIHIPSKEYPEMLFSTIYSRNEGCLVAFLHHIYQNIQGVLIIPQYLQENYLMFRFMDSTYNSKEAIRRFKKSVEKELQLVQHFLTEQENKTNLDEDIVIKFKTQLADLEKYSDFLYLCINK